MIEITHKPLILKREQNIKALVSEKRPIMVDAFSRQLKELFFIEHTNYIGKDKNTVYQSDDFKRYERRKENSYVYIYYPWNSHLVKCVEAEDYFQLKTNRNQDLITAEEQKKLYRYRVAVLGLSVGSNIAFALTQAGISREITLADFDELDTTNLNRIFAGVHQVGLNKALVAARRIFEDNPFAEIHLLSEGITEANLKPLLQEGAIDCIIEEIDDIPFKIKARKLAMEYKIPVLMITDNGDGVVFHAERYDLGHNKIFGKDVSYWDGKIKKKKMSKEEAGDIIMNDIVGGADKVDPRMLASVQRVLKKELVSWSQLGSAALLGAVVTTIFVKRIALGENTDEDIRAHIAIPENKLGSHN